MLIFFICQWFQCPYTAGSQTKFFNFPKIKFLKITSGRVSVLTITTQIFAFKENYDMRDPGYVIIQICYPPLRALSAGLFPVAGVT